MGCCIILAEKPSQAKAYSEAFQIEKRDKTSITLKPCTIFPEGAVITWGIGHLVELKKPQEYDEKWAKWDLRNLPIFPEHFEYTVKKEVKQQFNAVKRYFNQASFLINAADVDREGSNIFYSIYHMTGTKCKNIKRLWINSLEVDEVRRGFANLLDNQKDLLMYSEAKTRQISDWLVGMNASELYTLLLKEKGIKDTFSVGRVQSPTVYMIYQRQKEIENFVSKPFYELFGTFRSTAGQYEGKAKIKTDTIDELNAFLMKKGVALDKEMQGTVQSLEKKEKHIQSPKLHSLSTLQTVANKKWKYSPAIVLKTMQSLYQKKLVSYPRTDCNFITENEFSYLVANIKAYQHLINNEFEPNITPSKRYVDGSKVAEHYAIIPTKSIPNENTLNGLSSEERNIYDEILRNTLAMFHKLYRYEETKIITNVKDIEFETVGKIELEKGWKSLFAYQKNEESEKTDSDKTLPDVSKGESVLSVLQSKEGYSTAPKPYTEGQLINMMKGAGLKISDKADSDILKEVEGIGTEATRSGIIETIKKNGYIEVNKNIVSVTKKGIILCEAIEGTLLSSPVMTAKWESYLRQIGEGKGSPDAFINNIKRFVDDLMQKAPKRLDADKIKQVIKEEQESHTKGTCPVCKKGQMIDRKTFIGCSEYQNGCKFSINKTVAEKKLTDKNIKDLLEKGRTTKIKGFKNRKKESFEAALVIKDGNIAFTFDKKVTKVK
jgi:DNA topoisomerase-3